MLFAYKQAQKQPKQEQNQQLPGERALYYCLLFIWLVFRTFNMNAFTNLSVFKGPAGNSRKHR